MKIYTKTGDSGATSLFGGTRVPKHHIRIQSYGTLDELNSWLGMLRDQLPNADLVPEIIRIQEQLFVAGAVLATDPEKAQLANGKDRLKIEQIGAEDIEFLEKRIDAMEAELPPMTHFILPGGHPCVSSCHIARTVCRRAERMTTLLHDQSPVPDALMGYLNRLSDYLFVLARKLSSKLEAKEIPWIPRKKEE